MLWIYLFCCLLILVSVALIVKILVMRYSAEQIAMEFKDKLMQDTNTRITISSNDQSMRQLAAEINTQLSLLNRERHRFQQGNSELQSAVTNISHDLRTPLTAIRGYLDLLQREDQSAEVNRYLEIIRNRTEMLERLTEELFHYSIITSTQKDLQPEPVCLNAILEESIAAFHSSLLHQHIVPIINLPQDRIIRNLNRSSLSRIFSNLLNNAIKYSDGDLEISLLETGEIIFTNTASGLNEIQVGKLFDRFYTVESARNSTGLGLTIARTLVEQMGGKITTNYENNRLSLRIFFPNTPL